jgi:hypothetical protein
MQSNKIIFCVHRRKRTVAKMRRWNGVSVPATENANAIGGNKHAAEEKCLPKLYAVYRNSQGDFT